MKSLSVMIAVVLFGTVAAWGQQSGSRSGAFSVDAGDSGNPADRAPSTWISAARARHQFYMQARVQNPRQGLAPGTIEGLDTPEGTTGGSTPLGGLLDLVSQFGGLTGSGGTLGSLLGTVTGGDTGSVTATTGGTTVTGSTGGGATLEDLLRLRDELTGGSSGTQKSLDRAQSTAQTPLYETREATGGIGRLPKPDQFAQSVDTDRKFVARWAEQMVQTIFASLAIGFQSRDFVNYLTDALRPIFFPQTTAGSDTSGDGAASSDSGATDDGSGTSEEPGGGIEDLDPSGGDTGDDSGSII